MNKLKCKWILQITAVLLTVLTVAVLFRSLEIRVAREEEGLGDILLAIVYGFDLIPILVAGAVVLFPIQYFLGQKEKRVFRTVFHSILLIECLVEFAFAWMGLIGLHIKPNDIYVVDRCDRLLLYGGLNVMVLTIGTLILYGITNLVYVMVTLGKGKQENIARTD